MTSSPTWLDSADRLGDLYQRVCAEARKGRALCQTPPFVRDFLLERTLTPSIQTFGVHGTRLIDPACGTGHFLVEAARRLWTRWRQEDQADLERWMDLCWQVDGDRDRPPLAYSLAQVVLAQVVGVDLDPDCVAIARYRLTSLMGELTGLECVPYRVHVVWGDSLLHHRPRPDDDERFGPWPYDAEAVRAVLRAGQYTAVVVNPPYIRCPDAKLREAYRERYPTCHGQYSLAVPFTELVFGLACRGGKTADPAEVERLVQRELFAEETP